MGELTVAHLKPVAIITNARPDSALVEANDGIEVSQR
jgi:hypothetical protein